MTRNFVGFDLAKKKTAWNWNAHELSNFGISLYKNENKQKTPPKTNKIGSVPINHCLYLIYN